MKKIALVLFAVILVQGVSFAAFSKKVTYPGKEKAAVTFDHKVHAGDQKLACKSCHPGIFAKKKALANKITMEAINKGKFCGVCHKEKGKAFPVKSCERCHVEKTEK